MKTPDNESCYLFRCLKKTMYSCTTRIRYRGSWIYSWIYGFTAFGSTSFKTSLVEALGIAEGPAELKLLFELPLLLAELELLFQLLLLLVEGPAELKILFELLLLLAEGPAELVLLFELLLLLAEGPAELKILFELLLIPIDTDRIDTPPLQITHIS
jgi:hypothetical protein